MYKEIVIAKWLDPDKTRIAAKLILENDVVPVQQEISKYEPDSDGNKVISKQYVALTSIYSEEQIDKTTEELAEAEIKAEQERLQKEMLLKQEQQRQISLQRIFDAKLRAFEVPVIQDSENMELRTALRKAQTEMEVYAYASALIMESFNKQQVTK